MLAERRGLRPARGDEPHLTCPFRTSAGCHRRDPDRSDESYAAATTERPAAFDRGINDILGFHSPDLSRGVADTFRNTGTTQPERLIRV